MFPLKRQFGVLAGLRFWTQMLTFDAFSSRIMRSGKRNRALILVEDATVGTCGLSRSCHYRPAARGRECERETRAAIGVTVSLDTLFWVCKVLDRNM